ncbi:MAG: hypothetical protein LBR67_10850 [Dysgonamonadaceae bacterium]|jgi:hypothetical protein|nr:hypothetical protein [Dysgonamonadaceae bacterium]
MKQTVFFIMLSLIACTAIDKPVSCISSSVVDQVIDSLSAKDVSNKSMIARSVRQIAGLWKNADGDDDTFRQFCLEQYVSDPVEKEQLFLKVSEYLEAIYGNYNKMSLLLQRNIHENTGPLSTVDELFAAYDPQTHLDEDLYANKLAFVIALNFPELTLEEKEALGGDRQAWAYARLGDCFTDRVPPELLQANATAVSNAEVYIANYNIYMGHLLDAQGKKHFPDDMMLLAHWNLRDEIKANYNKGEEGLLKQQMIYEVMKRIILQDIPKEVINSGDYDWNPYDNTLSQSGDTKPGTPELTTRYAKMLDNFKTFQAIDRHIGNTYIDRKFSKEMEIAVENAEAIFSHFLASPELKKAGEIIKTKLGRDLDAFDIWYDGFKLRSNIEEETLSKQTRARYPNAQALEDQLPSILSKLGFDREKAQEIAGRIEVDAARGSGHAWGAGMKGEKAHLRTRIPAEGMDYKGYNIAIHEFGHNVEQTLSLYDIDYYLLNGVPNTAFTEALAFIFQKRDLQLLGIGNDNPEKDKLDALDKLWHLYEICGVSMLDIAVWKWLYAHPDATAGQLRDAVISLSKELWNEYFSPVFGIKDEPVLAVYSHMICYPLYLSAYAFGQIIEFQLEEFLKGKDFAKEIQRIYCQGRLTPNQWMLQATGEPLSTEPLLETVRKLTINN